MVVRSNPGSDLWGDFSGPARYAPLLDYHLTKTCRPSVIALLSLVCFQLRCTAIATSGPRTLDPVLSCVWMFSFDILSSSRIRLRLPRPAERLTPRTRTGVTTGHDDHFATLSPSLWDWIDLLHFRAYVWYLQLFFCVTSHKNSSQQLPLQARRSITTANLQKASKINLNENVINCECPNIKMFVLQPYHITQMQYFK